MDKTELIVELKDLLNKWRERDFRIKPTIFSLEDYYEGCNSATTICANELEELINEADNG